MSESFRFTFHKNLNKKKSKYTSYSKWTSEEHNCRFISVKVYISELPSPFHQFGLLVALASAWSLTWYQSPGSRVRVLVFAIYCKNCCYPPLCPRVDFLFSRLCPRVDFLFSCLCPRVGFLFSRHTWVGVLKYISELPSPFHQFGLLVALASAWSLTTAFFTI
jgi:hypothetical protein